MEIAIGFALLAAVSLVLGFWASKNYARIPKPTDGSDIQFVLAPKDVSYPDKPQVSLKFELLTELLQETAKRFERCPFVRLPDVFISPAGYFSEDANAFFSSSPPAIYFKDTYVNNAEPADLAHTMLKQLVHAWVYQFRHPIVGQTFTEPQYNPCYSAVCFVLGLEKPHLPFEEHKRLTS